MANKDDKQTTAPTVDPKDEAIAKLQAQLEASEKKNAEAEAARAEAEKALADLKAEQKNVPAGSAAVPNTVCIKLYKDQNIKDDVQVFVNGRQYIIQRGVNVDVPREVYEVLQNQEKMRNHIAAFNEKHETK